MVSRINLLAGREELAGNALVPKADARNGNEDCLLAEMARLGL